MPKKIDPKVKERCVRHVLEHQAEYAFYHALVRDVCYGQIPRAQRAERHRFCGIDELVEARVSPPHTVQPEPPDHRALRYDGQDDHRR